MRIWAALMVMVWTCACTRTPRQSAWAKTPLAKNEVRNAERAADGDFALQRLRDKVLADPADIVARIELAAYYDRMGMKELALDHYRLAGVRHPEDELAHLRLAQGLRQSDPVQARRELRQFVANFPVRMADTFSLLAILEDDAGELESGEQMHRRALTLAPQSDRLHNNLGYNLAKQERHAEAIAAFRKALKINGKSEVARNNLAASLAEQAGGAVRAFNVWRRSAGAGAAHNNLGAFYLRQGDYRAARREFEEALRLNPGLGEAWRNLAKLSDLDGGAAQVKVARTETVADGWRLLSGGFKKIFATESTDAIPHPSVTEVGEGLDGSPAKLKGQKTAE